MTFELLTKSRAAELRDLRERKHRYESGSFLVTGKKLSEEALASGWEIKSLITSREFATKEKALVAELAASAECSYEAPLEMIDRIDPSVTPSGICVEVAMPARDTATLPHEGRIACFVGIQDPGNLGTMIRTADWFGFTSILLSEGSDHPYNEKAVAASMGSISRVPVVVSNSIEEELRRLQEAGVYVIATSPRGNAGPELWPADSCLIMGSESEGLPEQIIERADTRYAIPGYGGAESLNVAVSFGIAAHSITSSRVS